MVIVVKDDLVLRFDTHALPVTLGSVGLQRGGFVHSLAAVVMNCWTGA